MRDGPVCVAFTNVTPSIFGKSAGRPVAPDIPEPSHVTVPRPLFAAFSRSFSASLLPHPAASEARTRIISRRRIGAAAYTELDQREDRQARGEPDVADRRELVAEAGRALQRRGLRGRRPGGDVPADPLAAELVGEDAARLRERDAAGREVAQIVPARAGEAPGDDPALGGEQRRRSHRVARALDRSLEQRGEGGVATAGETRCTVDRGGQDRPAGDAALDAGPEQDLALRQRRVETGPGDRRAVAERMVARPQIHARGGGLVRVGP